MGIWTLPIILLLVFQLTVKYTEAQFTTAFAARNTGYSLHAAPAASNTYTGRNLTINPTYNPRVIPTSKAGYLPLNHFKSTEWNTFSLRYNSNTGDDWLNEHNMVVVKSVMQIVNRLLVGINCHYNWSFTIAGNGAGMMLNKLPIKIYFAGVVGGAPDLGHR